MAADRLNGMTVSSDDDRAPYVQVADALRDEISSGALQPGQKLPSARQLADRFGVAVMTASSGVRVLREEGLVYSTQGRGTFVRRPGEDAAAASIPANRGLAGRVEELESQVETLTERLDALETLLGSREG
ncbi:GntR family transcriptional regulator [Kitasatospora indigofera]|uniref:GntR family transcriptional regulator n=2 Tax=Kitasatospora indigofera TaxID=67307 RepID=A0A919FDG8_9ACTN|nr:GntR family transcriptional regulator [Kitasatospora indigofera]